MSYADIKKLVIAGSRSLQIDPHFLQQILHHYGLVPEIIIIGGASGVDKSTEIYATRFTKRIVLYNADWELLGKAAGPIRNKKMAEAGDALLLIWDGESRGSRSMKSEMLNLNKPVYEFIIKSYNLGLDED